MTRSPRPTASTQTLTSFPHSNRPAASRQRREGYPLGARAAAPATARAAMVETLRKNGKSMRNQRWRTKDLAHEMRPCRPYDFFGRRLVPADMPSRRRRDGANQKGDMLSVIADWLRPSRHAREPGGPSGAPFHGVLLDPAVRRYVAR